MQRNHTGTIEDQDLVLRSQGGDLDAFNLLVERYQRLAYNVALRMVGDGATAEDATQDAFVSAYRAIGGFRGGSFKSWLLRIVTNSCRDRFRAARRARTLSLDEMLLNSPTFSPVNDSESPEEYALRRELGRVLSEGLTRLPEEQRLVVTLSDIQGLSYEEIAEVACCSLGTVKSRLNRGRARLRDFMMQRKELLPTQYRLDK
jgi:RNA polymerase sigma-70 factor (ECF subfamily)